MYIGIYINISNNITITTIFIQLTKDKLVFYREGYKAIKDNVSVDAPGSFIAYLASKTIVHAYLMDGHRYDVGTLQSYEEINNTYKGIIF